MPRTENLLSAAKVKAIKQGRQPGKYSDGGGLYLVNSIFGTSNWIYRYHKDGRTRHMGLGSAELVTLADARKARDEQRKKLKVHKVDPLEERDRQRQEARLEAARTRTFDECASAYIKAMRPSWRSEAHAQQWGSTLRDYVSPHIGPMAVADVTTADVMAVLEPHWQAKPETMSRVRARIELILDWAKASGFRDEDSNNPARWRGHLKSLLPARAKLAPVKHHPAIDYEELPALIKKIRADESTAARALEFSILVGGRRADVREARWSEFDLEARTWSLLGHGRIKRGDIHVVPLAARAMEILQELPRHSEVVFANQRGLMLGKNAMLNLLQRLRPGITPHGMRSSFKDWATERTNFPDEISEMALAHVDKNKVRAAYQRGPALMKRAKLMEAWDQYLAQPAPAGEVVPIKARA